MKKSTTNSKTLINPVFLGIFLIIFSLFTGCSNDQKKEKYTIPAMDFIELNEDLSYNSLTKVIYIKNRTYNSNYTYTPYYNANGNVVVLSEQIPTFKTKDISNKYSYDVNTKIVYVRNCGYNNTTIYSTHYNENGEICYYDETNKTITPIGKPSDILLN